MPADAADFRHAIRSDADRLNQLARDLSEETIEHYSLETARELRAVAVSLRQTADVLARRRARGPIENPDFKPDPQRIPGAWKRFRFPARPAQVLDKLTGAGLDTVEQWDQIVASAGVDPDAGGINLGRLLEPWRGAARGALVIWAGEAAGDPYLVGQVEENPIGRGGLGLGLVAAGVAALYAAGYMRGKAGDKAGDK